MVFHWSLSDCKSSQISRTLLSILADLDNDVVWIASTRPLISKSSCPCTKPLMTVPSAPITTGTTVTFMFHSYFRSLARSRYLSFFSIYFSFTLWSAGTAGSLLFLLTITRSGHLSEIRWPICISKSHRILCISFSRSGFWVVHILFVRMVKFKLLAQFPVNHLPRPVVSHLFALICNIRLLLFLPTT